MSFVLVRMVVRSTHHQTAWELLGTVDSKLVRRVERKIPLILSDGICRQNMWKVCIIAAFQRNHFQRFISMYLLFFFSMFSQITKLFCNLFTQKKSQSLMTKYIFQTQNILVCTLKIVPFVVQYTIYLRSIIFLLILYYTISKINYYIL